MAFTVEPKDKIPFKCERCDEETTGKPDLNKHCKQCGGYMRVVWNRE